MRERHLRELAAVDIPKAPGPTCGQRCELISQKRKIVSIDAILRLRADTPGASRPRCLLDPLAQQTGVNCHHPAA